MAVWLNGRTCWSEMICVLSMIRIVILCDSSEDWCVGWKIYSLTWIFAMVGCDHCLVMVG